jgi:hypothetical protein
MTEYKFTAKKIDLFGFPSTVISPINHSRVKRLICEFRDKNWDDGFRNWTRYMAIMWKGTNKWEIIPTNHPDYTWATFGLGLILILKGMEDEPTKRGFQVEEMKAEIKEYQENIKNLESKIRTMKRLVKKG